VNDLCKSPETIKKNKKEADKLRLAKGKKLPKTFQCPSPQCDFINNNWYVNKNKVLIVSHIKTCTKITKEDLMKIVFGHPLFKSKKGK
jgi:hypothetical protein